MSDVFPLCDQHGILLRRDAVLAGVDDNALARLVKAGVLVRMRHGAYADRSTYLSASEPRRHRMLCRAVLAQYDDEVALSHASSVSVQGGPEWGLDLSSVHLTHFNGGGRKGSRIVHHTGDLRVGDVRRHDGHWLTPPARAVAETTLVHGAEVGLVQANHFLHEGQMTHDQMCAAFDRMKHWPSSLPHHVVRVLATGLAESVGESRSLKMMWNQGIPLPRLQHTFYFPDGRVAGRVDFYWPELRTIGEFDGESKLIRYLRPGETVADAVIREKRREDVLRSLTGCGMVRWGWPDLSTPAHTCGRIRHMFSLSAAA